MDRGARGRAHGGGSREVSPRPEPDRRLSPTDPAGAPDPSGGLLGPSADAVFTALADRTRRQILVRLAETPDDAGAVARDLGLSRQAVAKQLRILETAGMVDAQRVSARRVHSVEPSRILAVSDLLGTVGGGWDRRLARIKELAEAGEGPDRGEEPPRR